jgi:hypothetical protein
VRVEKDKKFSAHKINEMLFRKQNAIPDKVQWQVILRAECWQSKSWLHEQLSH